MQSPYLLSPQTFHQDKVAQLNLKLKRWRLVTLIFLILTILATSILILAISQRNKPIINPLNQVDKVSQACSDFKFNNTNLTQFIWKIQYKNVAQNQQNQPIFDMTTKIISLDLSKNLLKTFNNNQLPDLQQLKLTETFSREHYDEVSSNNFPKLKKISVQNVCNFTSNQLPSLYSIQCQYNFFYVNNFSHNFIPNLNSKDNFNFINTNTFVENTLSLQTLRLQTTKGFQFHNNNLLKLKKLQIFCNYQTDLITSSQIASNTFPNLQSLSLQNCNVSDLNKLIKLKSLQLIYNQLTQNFVQQFNNNSYSQLQVLTVKGQKLKKFTNNHLPSLKQLYLGGSFSQQANICQGNYLPNLMKIYISEEWDQKTKLNLNCFKSIQNLESLALQFLAFPIENFFLPKLKQLDFRMQGDQQRFSNGYFPQIESVYLKNVNLSSSLKFSNITFGNTLEILQIQNSSIQQLSFDRQMENLESLSISYTNLQSLNCSTFKNMKQLFLVGNKLKDDIIDTLVECDLKNLRFLFLNFNLIEDKIRSTIKLKSKYPNLYLSL